MRLSTLNPFSKRTDSIKMAKSSGSLKHPDGPAASWSWRLPSERDYQRRVGDGSGSNLVGPGIDFITDSFVEAPIRIRKYDSKGMLGESLINHPLKRLIEDPNPYYSGELLWMPTIADWIVTGNGYWLPHTWTAAGEPLDLYWTSSMFLEPKPTRDGSRFLSHYEYKSGRGAKPDELAPEEVIHFRWGLDPRNPLKGYSRLQRVLREIFTDEEAARFTASLLHNYGVPGLMVFPKDDSISFEEAQDVKNDIVEKTTGDRRGEPIVMTTESGLESFGFNPQEMDLSNLRAIPESRVAAALQIPAAVLGFLAGMAQTKVGATMLEMREMGFETGVAPKMRLISGDLRKQALRHFTDDPRKYKIDHDLSEVRVLQEDQSKLVRRVDTMVKGGWMTVSRGKQLVGEMPIPEDDVYLRTSGLVAVDPKDQMPEPEDPLDLPELPVPSAGGRNGNGNGSNE